MNRFFFCNWRYFLCFYFWLLWKLNSLCCCYPSLSFGHVSLLLRQVNKKALNAWGRLLSFRYNLSSFFLGYILCFFLLYRIRVSIYPTNRHRLCFWTVYTNPVEVFFFKQANLTLTESFQQFQTELKTSSRQIVYFLI